MKALKNISLIILFCVFLIGRADNVQSAQTTTAQSRFDELIHLIRTGNGYQRAQAVWSLGRVDDQRVVPALMDSLRDNDEKVRTYAAQQLDRLADKRSTEALADALNDSNSNVRKLAAQGLAKIGGEQHVPALVASVINHLPDPNTSDRVFWYSASALDAIGKLTSEAPFQLVELVGKISDEKTIKDEDWWRLLKEVARCLSRIGDKAAYKELQRAKKSLEKDYQDYKTWYAVCKALAALNPQKMAFDKPTADILDSVRPAKITREGIQQKWGRPLVKLGDKAVEDLDWALRFESERDHGRKMVAIEALGEIGGQKAAQVLRRYIPHVSDSYKRGGKARHQAGYALRNALLALLKADPNKETTEEIIAFSLTLDSFAQKYLMHDVSSTAPQKIPAEIKVLFYEKVLLDSKQAKSFGQYALSDAARLLGQIGGPQAGVVLSKVFLESGNTKMARAAAKALGSIKEYDAIPTLIKASKLTNASFGTIAEAMGRIKDARAVPALQDLGGREKLSQADRLWIAAALARFGKDYDRNAAMVRQALPASLDQAKWLHDTETIKAVAVFVKNEGYNGERAISTLEAIGTKEAFEALRKLINLDRTIKPRRLQRLSTVAARMAEKLGYDSNDYYAEIAVVSEAVRGWFEIHQIHQPQPEERLNYEAVKRLPALARKCWMAEATRRLDLAAKQSKEEWKFHIPGQAVRAIGDIFVPELVPVIERIIRESRNKVSFHGKYKMVDFYNIRSIAAKILTEKTGKPHTFIDVDGRTHPGGWNPSQEK